ncbi:MAG: HupE/UreJ family protein [Vicinamibacterales bacterium]
MFLLYFRLGFQHILPLGADHVLFVVGLFLASTTLPALLWQVSAFTIAHAITLALATTGVVHVPPSIVEPLIAVSIAAIAVENLVERAFHWRRPLIVFGFGLLHGLGFGGALQALGLPPEDVLVALLGFNLGVEAGQVAVLASLALAVGWCQGAPWYRRRVVVPASAAIAVVGLYWAIQRLA